MPVTEESRHRLHQALDRTIGPEEAATLMEHLPPVGWADVATTQDVADLRTATRTDLANLEERIDLRFDAVGERFDHLGELMQAAAARQASMERRLDSIENRLTHQFWQFLTLVVAVGAILIGVLRYT
jgi:hypothetical protein